MTTKDLVAIAEAYFSGLREKDMSRVPWHERVVFRGPLAPGYPEPIQGRQEVESWFRGLYPALGEIRVIEHANRRGAPCTRQVCGRRARKDYRTGELLRSSARLDYEPIVATPGQIAADVRTRKELRPFDETELATPQGCAERLGDHRAALTVPEDVHRFYRPAGTRPECGYRCPDVAWSGATDPNGASRAHPGRGSRPRRL
jgi:hypothetical protein